MHSWAPVPHAHAHLCVHGMDFTIVLHDVLQERAIWKEKSLEYKWRPVNVRKSMMMLDMGILLITMAYPC